MNSKHYQLIAKELNITLDQIKRTAALIDVGATIPFISRYRKEVTGSLDAAAVTAIRDCLEQLRDLDKRRDAILKSLEENGHLTAELGAEVNAAETLTQIEDIYPPIPPSNKHAPRSPGSAVSSHWQGLPRLSTLKGRSPA